MMPGNLLEMVALRKYFTYNIRNICMWLSTAGRIISTAICMPFLRHPENMTIFRIPMKFPVVFCWMAVMVVALHRQVLNTIPLRSQIPRCHDRKKWPFWKGRSCVGWYMCDRVLNSQYFDIQWGFFWYIIDPFIYINYSLIIYNSLFSVYNRD